MCFKVQKSISAISCEVRASHSHRSGPPVFTLLCCVSIFPSLTSDLRVPVLCLLHPDAPLRACLQTGEQPVFFYKKHGLGRVPLHTAG